MAITSYNYEEEHMLLTLKLKEQFVRLLVFRKSSSKCQMTEKYAFALLVKQLKTLGDVQTI